ncbi:hypothetical protein ACQE3E_21915 [Methylomonas sp. MED-D]|uniref:hypothetical protein n=1 Tax=Methylomonas sp. MED-D TaxID=3418768 RepID=UPI003D070C0E
MANCKEMYRDAVVTFIDILGFREIVMTSEPDVVRRKLTAIKRFAVPRSVASEDEEEFEPITIQFSDSIVRVRPVDTETNQMYPIGIVFHELLDMVHAQGELVKEGVLLRGGIAYGQIHYDGSVLYGPALIKAYDLESKYAVHPRIVVEPELISELKSNQYLQSKHNSLEQELEYIEKLLRQNDDGIWFVDYIRAVASELDEIEMYPEFLEDHRNLIVNAASAHPGFSTVSAKYMWLAKYHNSCIEELSDEWYEHYSLEKSDLMITSDHIPVLQEIKP